MIGWRVGWVAGPADTVTDAGWAHVYNTTMPVAISRLCGYGGPARRPCRAECVAELERRRDTILSSLPGWPFVSPAGAGRFFSTSPRWASSQWRPRILLDDAKITPLR